MPTWKTAEEICARYRVGPERLADYSYRGMLARTSGTDGTDLFDEDRAARYFRLRSAAAVPVLGAKNYGVLGEMKLGAYTLPSLPSARDERARALRLGKTPATVTPLRRTGSG
jgi:hypothetical protein